MMTPSRAGIKSIQSGSTVVTKEISVGGSESENYPIAITINKVNVNKSVVILSGSAGIHYGYYDTDHTVSTISPMASLTNETTLTVSADAAIDIPAGGSISATAKWQVVEYY